MATYFVRIGGSDANAGTTAGAAWRTIGKALGAAGIASGDTVYVGAGVYRENVSVLMTSATVETKVIGDVDGLQTGDAGEVIVTNFLGGWNDTPSGIVINLSGRDFLTFSNLHLVGGASGNCIGATTATSTDIKIDNCVLEAFGTFPFTGTAAFATALNWTIQKSLIVSLSSTSAVSITLTTGVGADFDANVQIIDSIIWAVAGAAVTVTNSGTAANRGGGVDVLRCTLLAAANGAVQTAATNISTTIPCTVGDCLMLASAAMNAGTSGQITDLGGNVTTGSNTNVTAHATSKTATDDFPAQFVSLGHEWMWGMFPRRLFSPMLPGTLCRGHIGSATSDMEGRSRPEGHGRYVDSGTATAGAATTITDGGKAWKTDEHVGRLVRTTGGTGPNQVKHVSTNSATVLTIGGLSGDWATTPDSTTTYVIYDGPPTETDKATSGSTTTFVVSGAAWSVNKWAGYDLKITAGTNSGTTKSITSNTSTTLTTAAFASAIDSTSVGEIFWPGTSTTATQKNPGALETHDSAAKETTTTDAGSVGIVIGGAGSHEFRIPVDAASTTISVKARYDANHGTTNKPQAILLANGEVAVTTETKTMTSAADTWETLTFAAQTPSAKGVVTVRLVSRSDAPYGRAYFDTWSVT
jgi:hypothetical protein